jgi:hypothetical protein
MNSERFDKRLLENQSLKEKRGEEDTLENRSGVMSKRAKNINRITFKENAKNRSSIDKLLDL